MNTSPDYIPQTLADISEAEEGAVAHCVRSRLIGAGGEHTRRASEVLCRELGLSETVLTTSGTDALELAALLLDVQPGDTVIVPSFTFSSAATAFIRAGARVRFADIEPLTLGIDPASLRHLLDDSVRAVVPVHYAGMPCDLDGLLEALGPYERATLVEDNAHGLFGTYRGRPLGTFGPIGATSFHATKNLTTGEGGALLVTAPEYGMRAHVLAEKGTDRRAFMHGIVDKYTWRDTGSSFVLAEPLAAMLEVQLARREELFGKRDQLYRRYRERLAPHVAPLGIQLPGVRPMSRPVHHLFYVLMPSPRIRNAVMDDLNRQGIGATFHYLPLHTAPAAGRFGDQISQCPVTEDVSARILRLPFHTSLSAQDVDRVVDRLLDSANRHV